MKIRKAKKEDIKAISELSIKTYKEAFRHTFTPEELEKRLEERSVAHYNNVFDKDTILLAEENGQIIGYIQFGDAVFDMDGISKEDQELQRVYVLAEYQGRGIGKTLIEAALSDPRLKNASKIYLDVWEENFGAQKLYKSYGFEEMGKIDKDIIMVKKKIAELTMESIKEKLSQLFPEGQWKISESGIGESKQAFIASNGKKKVFVKLIKSSVLKRLTELGVAPKLIYDGSQEENPYIIQEFVEGEKPTKTWFVQNVETLAKFIKKYHQDAVLKDILEKNNKLSYQESIESVLKGLNDDILNSNSNLFADTKVKEALNLLQEKGKVLKPTPLVPTHSDPNPQNLLLTKTGIIMVDWDDIFLSDPFKDIGLILWWYIPRNKWPDFFKAYSKELDEEKLRWWIALNTLSIAAWYGKQGNNEYVRFFINDALMALDGKENSHIFVNNTI